MELIMDHFDLSKWIFSTRQRWRNVRDRSDERKQVSGCSGGS
jgi:hypothetical protein